jgi:hypothetical protein
MKDHLSLLVIVLNLIEDFTGVTPNETKELPTWRDFRDIFMGDMPCQIIVQGNETYKRFSFHWVPNDRTLTIIRREQTRNRVERFWPTAVHRPSAIPQRSPEDIKFHRVVFLLKG